MHPKILGNINPRGSFIPKQSVEAADRLLHECSNSLGDVEPIALEFNNPYIGKLLDFGGNHGFFYRKQSYYTGSCFLALHGSVGLHDDMGIGHLLCWLLRAEDFKGKSSQWGPSLLVFHDGKPLEVQPRRGDVFIFDGNRQHAWFSNESCLIVQTTVGIRRGTRVKPVLQ